MIQYKLLNFVDDIKDLDKLNKMAKDGWRVVCSIHQAETLVLERKLKKHGK
jgi:hypothetical protein